ncbi:hypothetical protein IJ843_05320 [bacterium]|nr:hypothetical protein [bacterium]
MEENNTQKKIVSAANPNITKKQQNLYSTKYYVMFFTIMIISFLIISWLCNYTKLKEMFQIIALTALSIAIAEYSTRNIIK